MMGNHWRVMQWLLTCMWIIRGQELSLPEYMVSECYGDTFNFDCGSGNMIRINQDFFGYSNGALCEYGGAGDCTVSNPKSNSLIHRYCTGQRWCTHYMVERRACDGYFTNYQQVEYQCIPESKVVSACSETEFESYSTYIASPRFPRLYPPNLHCSCVVSARNPAVQVKMEIVFLAIQFSSPCRDWLKIGDKKTCGTTVDMYTGRIIPIEFHTDRDGGHTGFWLHFQATEPSEPLIVRCGKNVTSNMADQQPQRPAKATPPVPKRPMSIQRVPGVPVSPRPPSQTYRPDQELLDMLIKQMQKERHRAKGHRTESRGPSSKMQVPNAALPQKVPKPTETPSRRHQLTTGLRSYSQPTMSTRLQLRPHPTNGFANQEASQTPRRDITHFHRVPSPAYRPTSQSFDLATEDENKAPVFAELSPRPAEPVHNGKNFKPNGSPRIPLQKPTPKQIPERPITPKQASETLLPAIPSEKKWKHSEINNSPKLTVPPETSKTVKKTESRLPSNHDSSHLPEVPKKTSENRNLPPEIRHLPREPETISKTDLVPPNLKDTSQTGSSSPSLNKSTETEFYSVDVDYIEEVPDSDDLFVPDDKENYVYEDAPGLDYELDPSYVDYAYYPYYPGVIGGNYSRATAPAHPEKNDAITLSMIIVGACVGILLTVVFFVIILVIFRRRRLVKREQETSSRTSPSPASSELSSPSSSPDDNDSGKGLLAAMKVKALTIRPDTPSSPLPSYTKGSGHQTYVDVDSLYAKPICKSDRQSSSSSGASDTYEDVVVRRSPVISDSDGSLYCTPTPVALDRLPTLKKSSTAPDSISRPRFYGRRRRKGLRSQATSQDNARDRSCTSNSGDGGGGGEGNAYTSAKAGANGSSRRAPGIAVCDSESSDCSARLARRHRLSIRAHRLSDSEPDLHSSCSEYEHPHGELLRLRQHSIASLSELAEVTFVPDLENQAYNDLELSVTDRSDDTDWETRSAISI